MQLGLNTQGPQQVTLNGVVTAKPLSAILMEEAAQAAKNNPVASSTVVSSLVSYIRNHWQLAKTAKMPIEKSMLSAVRARRGEYDSEKLEQIRSQGGSEIYMMIFATKARQMKALLTDILIGTGLEKPWTLNPTPMPDLPDMQKNQILEAVYSQVQQYELMGQPVSVDEIRQVMMDLRDEVHAKVMEQAKRDAEFAELEVEDMMVEGGFKEALDQFLDDLSVFKTAFIKGPIVRMSNELRWVEGPEGRPVAQVQAIKKRVYERVDPFNIYPLPWNKGIHDGALIERHKLSRYDLSSMIGLDGYSADEIRAVLDEHGSGGLHEWLWTDNAVAAAEGRNPAMSTNTSDLIDALQYWGCVSGKMLREWGMTEAEVPDEAKEYEVEAWLVGKHVIKAVLNQDPLYRRPYYCDGFSRIPGAFWHNSLYDVVADCQDMCNAAARALANNMGIGSGPQVVVNVDRLPHGEDITEMYPWKIWQTTNDPMGSSAAPVSFFQPGNNSAELMSVFERFSSMADEYSGIPKYMAGMSGGEGGAGRTASGMSMMITNASKQVKHTVSSIDTHIIEPCVERTYQHILMYAPEKSITGDLQVQARGAVSLVAKESAQVRLNEFLMATGNPVDMQIVGMDGRAELLRQAVKRLDVPNPEKIIPTAQQIKMKAAQAQMQQMQQPQQPQQIGGGQELMDGAPVTDNFQPTGA